MDYIIDISAHTNCLIFSVKERLGEEPAPLKWAHIIYRPNLLSTSFDNLF